MMTKTAAAVAVAASTAMMKTKTAATIAVALLTSSDWAIMWFMVYFLCKI